MSVSNLLFTRKYRPKTLSNIVLLPRIRKIIENGIQQHLLFYGHSGTGKSALVEILLKDKNYIKINASKENGIDTLREKITDFCETMPNPFVKTDDKMKYVYLEEFDGVTTQFQEGFKSFIEEYDHRVRFIITMNDISDVIAPILSRFNPPHCFNPSSDIEKNYLTQNYHKYLLSIIKHSKIDIKDNILNDIILNNFPDLRACVNALQTIFITGDLNKEPIINQDKVIEFIMNGKNNFSDNFYFVMDNWVNQPRELINLLGRPFYKYLLINHKNIIDQKGFQLIELNKQYNAEFEITTDPPLHVFSLVCDLKKIINE